MFKNIFKRCWIAEEVVRYLESLPRFFRVSYTVDVGGRSVKFPIRDEDGNLYDFNRHDRRVTGIVVNYQDNDYGCETYYVDDIVDAKCIPYMKEKFDKLFERFPVSKAKIKAKHLYDMQCKLRKEIERVTKVVGAYDGKDIVYNLGALDDAHRNSILDTVRRLGNDCVSTTLLITVSGSTDEEIGATLNELAMVDAAEMEKFVQAAGGDDENDGDIECIFPEN